MQERSEEISGILFSKLCRCQDSEDGIGKGYTREDHSKLADKIFSAYSKVQDVRALATVLGEADLTEEDKKYLKFGNEFEDRFVNQDSSDNRSMDDTLSLMEELLRILE